MNLKSLLSCSLLVVAILPSTLISKDINPFAINNGEIPTKIEYSGTLWKFNYNYPLVYKEPLMPWRDIIKGKSLTKDNAYAYIMSLKKHIAPSIKNFLLNPEKWNKSSQRGWYSMLWAGEEFEKTGWEGRDSIYGTYTGQIMKKEVYSTSGLKVNIRNHASIYYNDTASYTLHKVWEECDEVTKSCVPSIEDNQAQFKEGSIIIKAAGVTATPEEWPVLEGAAKWKIFRKPFDLSGTINDAKPEVTDIRVGIFDIIVKDSIASPETGWVFTTLVYDKDARGNDAWDKMVPLGAMWGNDPKINSDKEPLKLLLETYVSLDAPAYSTVTLGYGKRLSGPFDIAVKYDVEVDGKIIPKLRSSSCLSCHGTSTYPGNATFFYPAEDFTTKPWKMYSPGSKEWNDWFQNRKGTETQSTEPTAIALDYSTFLEAVLMNYASTLPNSRNSNNDMFEKWKKYRYALEH